MIFLDFETRSRIDLKKTGVWKYAEDESTQVLCMAYQQDDGEVKLWTPALNSFVDTRDEFFSQFQNEIFVAHNAGFETAIYEEIMVGRHGFPAIRRDQWRCSAAKAAAHAIPRGLADATGALALDMQKDKEGRATMMKLAKPRKPTKNDKSEWHNDPADFERLYRYCMQDIRAEVSLYKRLPDLNLDEQKVWFLDQEINARGVAVDLETVEAAITLIEQYSAELTKELDVLTDSVVGSHDERDKMLSWFAMNGLELPNLQAGQVVDTLAVDIPPHVKNPEKVRRVLEIRQQLAKTSTAKYYAIREAVCKDGRLRDLLMYHGASTGRWAGKGPQPQNLPRNTEIKDVDQCAQLIRRRNLEEFKLCYEDPMDALSMMLRAMFIASPGKILVGGDYAAIEVRVLFWLAGEEHGLEMFRKGEDLYKDLAQKIYHLRSISEVTKAQRELGKRGILGCGYGMGAKKFKMTCKTHANIEIEEMFSEQVIEIYRSNYRTVVNLWYSQEAAAIKAVKTGLCITSGKIKWKTHGGFLYCRLPSGRCLAYCHPKIEFVETPWGEKREALTFMSVNSLTKKWERGSTYGGSIVENITQAVARDIMVNGMMNAKLMGFDVLLTVHDELITEFHAPAKSALEEAMVHLPKWAEGLPIKVETWSSGRYEK